MKKIFLIFLLISCNSMDYKSLSKDLKRVEGLSIRNSSEEKIQNMLMFLWPKNIGPEQELLITEVISLSIDIFKRRKTYLLDLKFVSSEYNQKNCDCHLYYECENDVFEDESFISICEELEKKQSDLDKENEFFYGQYRKIKEMIQKMQGHYIDLGMDDDFIDIGKMDFLQQKIVLNKANLCSVKRKKELISWTDSSRSKIKLHFDECDLRFNAEVDVLNENFGAIYQGELKLLDGRRGIIYWESLK